MAAETKIIIIGAGAVGLSIGWRLARRGAGVVIFERGAAGRATSWLAAGMLAPDAEIGFEELELYRLNRESARRWPAFVEDLESDSGMPVDFRTEGTLIVADDRDAAEALRRRYQFMREMGLTVEWLTGAEALEIEPFIAPHLAAAVHSPRDYQVDNRLFVDALAEAFRGKGGELREHRPVRSIEPDAERPHVVLEDGERIAGSAVIVAAGAWSRTIEGLRARERPPIRPVKGQMLELLIERPFDLRHVVRGPNAYLAPKSNGRLLVGATSEEMGFDERVTAGGLYHLLEHAWEIVPGIYDLPVVDSWAGLRPASRDHLPIIGYGEAPGVVMATGFYRHGILLTPVTSDEIARLLLEQETSDWIEPFSPRRFQGA
jgi:glycine oxidase